MNRRDLPRNLFGLCLVSLLGIAPICRAQSAAGGQQVRLGSNFTLTSSLQTIPLNTSIVNTSGTAIKTAWQSGMYEISGKMLAYTTGGQALSGNLLVNGQIVDSFYNLLPAATGSREVELPFSVVTNLNAGDSVSVQMLGSNGGSVESGIWSGLSLIGFNSNNGVASAKGQQARLSTNQNLSSTLQTVPLNLSEFNNTAGALNTAWQSGTYHLTGKLLAFSASSGAIFGNLLVNGEIRDSIYEMRNGSREVSLPISLVTRLNAGDVVSIQMASTSGTGQVESAKWSGLSMTGFAETNGRSTGSAQQLRMPSSTFSLTSAPQTLPFSNVEYNTMPSSAGIVFRSGLYQICGKVGIYMPAIGNIYGEVLVNGVVSDGFYHYSSDGAHYVQVPFSSLMRLAANDVVSIRLRSSISGAYVDGAGKYTGLSLIGFEPVPEPASLAMLVFAGAVLSSRRR